MSRTRRRSRRPREPEVDWEVAVTPGTGELGLTGYPAQKSAPAITPLGASRQVRAYVISCEERDCGWSSGQESSPGAAELRLLAHARAAHPGQRAARVDVRVRSRKYRFPIEVVDL